mmetsp:Transcript_25795/g.76179  ORF Transcript_25795/g.76179 Transcript_25795/m.76179 type:complete len:200 (+) Transcript_25795:1798-2397(+)
MRRAQGEIVVQDRTFEEYDAAQAVAVSRERQGLGRGQRVTRTYTRRYLPIREGIVAGNHLLPQESGQISTQDIQGGHRSGRRTSVVQFFLGHYQSSQAHVARRRIGTEAHVQTAGIAVDETAHVHRRKSLVSHGQGQSRRTERIFIIARISSAQVHRAGERTFPQQGRQYGEGQGEVQRRIGIGTQEGFVRFVYIIVGL